MHRCAAVDLGAESGRVMLCRWDGRKGEVEEVHRFPNQVRQQEGSLFWDLDSLWKEILEGLRKVSEAAGGFDSVGIDGWAVDYVLLDRSGAALGPAYCYRDPRNHPQMLRAFSILPEKEIYRVTGIQFLPFNTLYQLLAHRSELPEQWERAALWLNIPEYFLYLLSGAPVAEYTNATHTQMVDVRTGAWSERIVRAFDLDLQRFPRMVYPGTVLGRLKKNLASELGAQGAKVVAPACHDTGAAVAGIPHPLNGAAFISSGTWSLIGVELDRPILSDAAFQRNFTNEGGVGDTFRFLKNVSGMWLLQQCLKDWQKTNPNLTVRGLIQQSQQTEPEGPWFRIEEQRFLAPNDMAARIGAALQENGFAATSDPADLTRAILRSLARRHSEVIEELRETTGKPIERACIVGGGVRNEPLNRLTGFYSGVEVLRGPSESAAAGNAAVQIAAMEGDVSRQAVFDIASRLSVRQRAG